MARRSKPRGPSGDVGEFGSADVAPLTAADCPKHCTPAASEEWRRLIAIHNPPGKPPKLLASDRAALATYCDHWGDYTKARAGCEQLIFKSKTEDGTIVEENPLLRIANRCQQQMRLLAVEMGLTPASRPRVHRPEPAAKQPPAADGQRGGADMAPPPPEVEAKPATPSPLKGLRLIS